LLEAAERGFDFVIASELAACGLGQAFQDSGKMRRIDGLRLSLVSGKGEHGPCDFILAAGW
jgi:hypothetical protein